VLLISVLLYIFRRVVQDRQSVNRALRGDTRTTSYRNRGGLGR
jgi:hypothetical protein